MSKTKILFLAANPIKSNHLALDQEVREINKKIRASEFRDSLELVPAFAARADDLQEELLQHQPHIVHFSGHGNEKGEIILVGRNGRPKAVTLKTIQDLFSIPPDNIRAVVLNACYSETQARLLTSVIDCAVGMESTVSDKGAIAFAASFYRALGYGRSVQTAFELGKHSLEIEGFGGKNAPQLKLKDGVRANEIIFANGSDGAPQSATASRSDSEAACAINLYLTTIKTQKFDIDADYVLDWRDHFVKADENKRGHQLTRKADWNRALLAQLYALERRINEETHCRMIRARGLARLSAWFAFGHIFSEVNRYVIEVDQQSKLWRTDAEPSSDFKIVKGDEDDLSEKDFLDPKSSDIAIGVSVKDSLGADVREHLRGRQTKVAAFLHLRPERDLGLNCLRDAGDAVALAIEMQKHIRNFVRQWTPKRVLLFYCGPLSGACFIGHRLNAIGCKEIQIMENLQPGYAPSFLLT